MKRRLQWFCSCALLCALLVLVLLVQRPAIWPVLVVLAVLWLYVL